MKGECSWRRRWILGRHGGSVWLSSAAPRHGGLSVREWAAAVAVDAAVPLPVFHRSHVARVPRNHIAHHRDNTGAVLNYNTLLQSACTAIRMTPLRCGATSTASASSAPLSG